MENVLPCIVTDIQKQYSVTCTEKEQHDIIISNRDAITNFVQIDPMKCKMYFIAIVNGIFCFQCS